MFRLDRLRRSTASRASAGAAPYQPRRGATTTAVHGAWRRGGAGAGRGGLDADGTPIPAGRGAAAQTPRGLTVQGEVKNYVPVTDEMLRNPPPGDWLMARRNYQAWSYSPLDRDHARQRQGPAARLGLGDERRRREPDRRRSCTTASCISCNTGNIVQALDAATGDLIWEHEVGPIEPVGIGSMRNIAIYQDKIILATTDARLVALDARNGKLVWDDARSPIARKGYSQHQRTDRRAAAR